MKLFDIHTHRLNIPNSIFNAERDINSLSPNQYFSIGLHPWYLYDKWEEKWSEFRNYVSNQNCLAIGEAGFDRLRGPELSIQKAALEEQANTAKTEGIPLILHCVKGHDLLLEYLKNTNSHPEIIWHGWNLKTHLAEQLLPFSINFSFGEKILDSKSNASLWLKNCPKERIFLETDNSDKEIDQIYQAASLILGLSVEDLERQVIQNWNRISSKKLK
ncbi:TatD family hydrolase [Algoriphagus marincola]|uniref:TatD family hydrolase n=1 Tax=Algoriphagus marincola TaxID=264027 RepID=A0ABS7N6M0_9BACT|nr:TatD family hydrolase [Algoriphagus marincola]MBY5951967.1 TatD family hydrolase [Algoriphagus marincola]